MKTWAHNELAEDLANIKQTMFLDIPLGSVQLNDVQRADVLEVKPSYKRFCVGIYEIKISRNDFLSDIRTEKWRGYLEHCHRFYFAACPGVVGKDDIPKEAGLVIRGETGWSTIKAAPARDIEIPYMTLLSLIFSKQREFATGRHRRQLLELYHWNSKKDKFYKSLGKKLGDALRNYDKYQEEKSNFEYELETVKRLINEGLGESHRWPITELAKLVRRIKETANNAS